MQELTQQETIGFLTIAGGSMLLSYLWIRIRQSLLFPLILWGIGTTTWFLYNKASNNPVWFMDLTDLGTIIGSIGCIGFGLFMAFQTFMMFELTAKMYNNKYTLLIPLIVVMAGIALCLINAGYIGLSPMWIWGIFILVAVSAIIATFNNGIDGDGLGTLLEILLLCGCAMMYIDTFTNVIINFGATVSGIIILGLLFISSTTRNLLTDNSYSPSEHT